MNPDKKKKSESESKLVLEPVALTKSAGITEQKWKETIDKEQAKPGSGYKGVKTFFDSKASYYQELEACKKVFENRAKVASVKSKI
jgi:hypothetical protein